MIKSEETTKNKSPKTVTISESFYKILCSDADFLTELYVNGLEEWDNYKSTLNTFRQTHKDY